MQSACTDGFQIAIFPFYSVWFTLVGCPNSGVFRLRALALAKRLVDAGTIPRQAGEDALHIAMATLQGMDFLLTWNCKHIANASMWSRIDGICRAQGHQLPAIATPEQLQEE